MKLWQRTLQALSAPASLLDLSQALGKGTAQVSQALTTLQAYGAAREVSAGWWERTAAGAAYLDDMHPQDVPADITPEKPIAGDSVVDYARRNALPSVWHLAGQSDPATRAEVSCSAAPIVPGV